MNIFERVARRIARWLFKAQSTVITREQIGEPTLELAALAEQLRKSFVGLPVQVGYPHPYHDLNTNVGVITLMMISEYLHKHLYTNEKYTKSKRITHYAQKFYSMVGEDGVIREICRRIGVQTGQFVEFGVAYDGLENNTLYLLHKGWNGLWIEASQTILRPQADRSGIMLKRVNS